MGLRGRLLRDHGHWSLARGWSSTCAGSLVQSARAYASGCMTCPRETVLRLLRLTPG